MRREEYLSNQALTANSGITHWILVNIAESEYPRRVLCGCESIRKRAIVVQYGQIKEVISHSVTNVFCPPEHGGRGYAKRMMRELSSALRTHQTEGATIESPFSTLWSDIGGEFYSNLGWKAFASSQICIPSATSTLAPPGLSKVKLLRATDLVPLCDADERGLRKALMDRPASSHPAVSLLPDFPTISWHHAREDFIGTELHGRTPEVKGALIPGRPGQRAWCYWTATWNPNIPKNNTLHILRLVVEDTDPETQRLPPQFHCTIAKDKSSEILTSDFSIAKGFLAGMVDRRWIRKRGYVSIIELLLRAAQAHAKRWNMKGVELWNPTPETVEAARRIHREAKVVERDRDSIPSILWLGPEADEKGVEWIGNEKYGWC